MGDYHGDISGDTLRATATTTEQVAAVRAVLLRYEQGHLDATQARIVLQALGLVPVPDGGRYDSSGEHETRTARLKVSAGGLPRTRLEHKESP
jgi:hypothetical protein